MNASSGVCWGTEQEVCLQKQDFEHSASGATLWGGRDEKFQELQFARVCKAWFCREVCGIPAIVVIHGYFSV